MRDKRFNVPKKTFNVIDFHTGENWRDFQCTKTIPVTPILKCLPIVHVKNYI